MGKSLSLSIFFISLSLFATNEKHNLAQANGPASSSDDLSSVKELNQCQSPNYFARFFEQMSQQSDCTPEDRAKWGALANKIYEQGQRPRWKRLGQNKQEQK